MHRGGIPGTAGTASAVPLFRVVRRRRTSFLRRYFRKNNIITSINYLYKLNNLLAGAAYPVRQVRRALYHFSEWCGVAGPHEMNELVMDSTHTTFLISRRTTFRKGVPRLMHNISSLHVWKLSYSNFAPGASGKDRYQSFVAMSVLTIAKGFPFSFLRQPWLIDVRKYSADCILCPYTIV